jgi:hypothetical protein
LSPPGCTCPTVPPDSMVDCGGNCKWQMTGVDTDEYGCSDPPRTFGGPVCGTPVDPMDYFCGFDSYCDAHPIGSPCSCGDVSVCAVAHLEPAGHCIGHDLICAPPP